MMVQNICFLEASYQRSKEDLVYGRTLIFSEKDTIKEHFHSLTLMRKTINLLTLLFLKI